MPRQITNRAGRILPLLVIVLLLVIVAGMFAVMRWNRSTVDDAERTALLHTVQRDRFEAYIVEPGDVASSSNVEIRCKVQSRGSAGTAILRICDEGMFVKKGDFLVQFDDSVLKTELTQQRITVANDNALLIQAKSDLDTAERTLREYEQGLFLQEREVIEGELFVAEEELRRAMAYVEFSRRLNAYGFINQMQMRADEFAVEKGKKDVAAVRRKLKVYDEFTKDKMVGQYSAEIDKQKANVQAAQYTLDLSKQRLTEIEEQIRHCLVTAPSEGQVVHANERDRRGDAIVIEEGTIIRDNQIVIRLPDIRKMEVHVKINESHVNKVKPGQPVRIELEADPDQALQGKVKEVAAYPFPMRWHGAPLEYGAKVTIIDPPPTIRPGLRAKVRIFFEQVEDVLQVPIAAVMEHEGRHYCLIRREGKWLPRHVTIGSNNNSVIIVRDGLTEGERVALDPFQHIERSDLPSLVPDSAVAGERRPSSVSQVGRGASGG